MINKDKLYVVYEHISPSNKNNKKYFREKWNK